MGEQGLKKSKMASILLRLLMPRLALKVRQLKVTVATPLRVVHKILVARLLLVARLALVAWPLLVTQPLLVARPLLVAPAQGALQDPEQLLKRQLSFPTASRCHFSLDPVEILHQQLQIGSWSCILSWERPLAGATGT